MHLNRKGPLVDHPPYFSSLRPPQLDSAGRELQAALIARAKIEEEARMQVRRVRRYMDCQRLPGMPGHVRNAIPTALSHTSQVSAVRSERDQEVRALAAKLEATLASCNKVHNLEQSDSVLVWMTGRAAGSSVSLHLI